jgi:hypothetical protein
VLTDVTEASGTEERVGTRVRNGIGVAVAVESSLAVEHDSAQHEDARRIVAETMDVESLTDSEFGRAHD